MPTAQPIYTTVESVKARLRGKVTFEGDSNDLRARPDRVMGNDLLAQLIADAETAVEQDLRGRYAVPFVSISKKTWGGLPDHTKRAIRSIVDARAVIMILVESFGQGTHISPEGYLDNLQNQYDALLRRLMGQDMEGQEFGERRFRKTPPLDDLALSPTNIADDGYRGRVIDAGGSRGESVADFAARQINDPRLTMFNLPYGSMRGPR